MSKNDNKYRVGAGRFVKFFGARGEGLYTLKRDEMQRQSASMIYTLERDEIQPVG